MKNKDIESTTKAIEEVLSYHKEAPNLIMSDNDSSFLGSEFQKVLVKNDIHHDPNAVGDHSALGIIDNFAKRIKRILTAHFLQTKKKNWIDIIQKIVRTYNYSPHSALGGYTPAEVMSNDDELIHELILVANLFKSEANGTATDLKVGDSVRIKISDGFIKGTDPRYGGKVHVVKEIYGKNLILDNDKKYIRAQLLQVPANSVSDERPNTIQKAKTAKKRAKTTAKPSLESMMNFLSKKFNLKSNKNYSHLRQIKKPEKNQVLRKVRLKSMTGNRPTSTSASEGRAASPRRSSLANW
jgi:hypothetical protein